MDVPAGRRYVVAAVDKFRGSLRADEVAAALVRGISRAAPTVDVMAAPVADGGEGTLDAARASGFELRALTVSGPTGEPVDAAFAFRSGTAVVELAQASGLTRLPDGKPAPLTASSRGTGELIRAALDEGAREIVLGVGGSASTDGGAGMLQALGARLLDDTGDEIGPGGAALVHVARVDLAALDGRLAGTRFTLASDVDNPLLGPTGAARMFGPQKGADTDDQDVLETALARWSAVLAPEVAVRAGAGAAGGVGFAALAALGAEFRYGADVVLELIGVQGRLTGASLVITGEGRLDAQTALGKAPAIVARTARAAHVPVVAICGSCDLDESQWSALGFAGVYALSDLEPDRSRSMAHAATLVERAAEQIATDWLTLVP